MVPEKALDPDTGVNASYRYADGLKIAMISSGKPDNTREILTENFHSARAPEISHEGTQMVFSGQQNEGEAWQIWILNLETKEFSQVTACQNNCTDPAWLPDGRIVFSKYVNENELKHHALFSIAADGCCEQRLSFQPHEDLNATVLHDGRILYSSQQIYPELADTKYLVMRPDGTKAELFYVSEFGNEISQAVELNDQVLFVQAGTIKSVKFSRPLHTINSIEQLKAGLIQEVSPFDDNHLLTSVLKPAKTSIGIASFDLESNLLEDIFFDEDGYHAMEPVIIKKRSLPRNLPSRVNSERETGYVVCMDADASQMEPHLEGRAAVVQVLGVNDVVGEAEIAEDGSFYIELTADQPVRFQTLNDQGDIIRGPSSWIWVRPNERRGCVGCHQDHEIAPENTVPKAIEKGPVAMIK
jgi:hypothetical protein